MPKPTLIEVFGTNASQTATSFTISKNDLISVGLTASATNSAEALLAAIILKAKAYLTEAAFEANIDQSLFVGTGFKSTTVRGTNNTQYITDQLVLNLAKIDPLSPLDPDDYQ
jgi:hypothetical protein